MKLALLLRFLARHSLRATVGAVGFGLLGVGIVLLFLPGPGLLVVFSGLALLGTQFAWAERALDRTRARAARARDAARARARARRRPPPQPS